MTTYRYLTVDEWGGRWARPPVAEKLLDAECYVHHSAGNPWDQWDAAKAFRTLNEYAINSKGYSFLDYDVLVHHNTATDVVTIGEGRGKWLSAATRNRNEQGEAICALGYFHPGHSLSRQPSPGMLEGIARGIVWGIEQGWLSRDTQILGHRDNPAHPGATGCPGDYLYAQLPSIRARVASLLSPTRPPEVIDPPEELPEMNDYLYRIDGYADVVRITGNVPAPVSPTMLPKLRAELGDIIVEPEHKQTKWWLEARLGYSLSVL